ncbi:hypothetical protein PsorP6_011383 [Peronosclerospora sorghi]|uniref:Uncharacterized protein n=1 Tax=Peronosclerospora sorghi TaxID=230839 RepID=A0ACC0WIU5_9STRA|nr:hypothetical protein PsorP6_011383 [Peronosclerospora sorghi]
MAEDNVHVVAVVELRVEDYTRYAMNAAAANGHLDIVKFLHFHRREGCTTAAMDLPAAHGHLHVVKFLHRYRREGGLLLLSIAPRNTDICEERTLRELRVRQERLVCLSRYCCNPIFAYSLQQAHLTIVANRWRLYDFQSVRVCLGPLIWVRKN